MRDLKAILPNSQIDRWGWKPYEALRRLRKKRNALGRWLGIAFLIRLNAFNCLIRALESDEAKHSFLLNGKHETSIQRKTKVSAVNQRPGCGIFLHYCAQFSGNGCFGDIIHHSSILQFQIELVSDFSFLAVYMKFELIHPYIRRLTVSDGLL